MLQNEAKIRLPLYVSLNISAARQETHLSAHYIFAKQLTVNLI